ncbi:MAG: hypothetical protein HY000_06610 [Planctomycetes bacterium]|nr:hypothetical protein [Planctomycetota bacterium]
MTQEQRPIASLFTQVDISAGTHTSQAAGSANEFAQLQLLSELVKAQQRTNELLEELVSQVGQPQRQRTAELAQWKQANPRLARDCRVAAETLSRVQTEFLQSLANEVQENGDALMDGEFMLTEFVDRFGPRLAHLNGVLQVLSQLGNTPAPANNPATP